MVRRKLTEDGYGIEWWSLVFISAVRAHKEHNEKGSDKKNTQNALIYLDAEMHKTKNYFFQQEFH